jgi:ABC-2 type transport system ATP-binding protein
MSVAVDGCAVQARVVGAPAVVPGLLKSLDESGVEVASVEAIRATLDDVFLHLTGRSLREGTDDGVSDADTEGVAA